MTYVEIKRNLFRMSKRVFCDRQITDYDSDDPYSAFRRPKKRKKIRQDQKKKRIMNMCDQLFRKRTGSWNGKNVSGAKNIQIRNWRKGLKLKM